MMKEWTKWMLTTTILSMSLAPAGAYAQETANGQSAPNASFTDIAKVSQDRIQAVQDAVDKGLLNGFPDGKFQPDKELTRQELAVILARALKLMPTTTPNASFSDTGSLWAAPYIEAVRNAGLMGGFGDGSFRPDNLLTREQLATVFVRAVGGTSASGGAASGTGSAAGASNWAAEMVQRADRLGLMQQEQGTTPKSAVNREDVAAYLLDVFNAKEQTAVIQKIDGDYVSIDGETVLVTKELKALFAGQNLDALKGAKLTYSQQNKNIDGLAKLEIAVSGTEAKPVAFDSTGSRFDGVLVIAGDKVAVKGETLKQIVLGEKASSIELNAKVGELTVTSGQAVTISGDAAIQTFKVDTDKARIKLGKDIAIDKVELPTGVKLSDVIANYDAVKSQIKNREADPAPVYTGGSSVSVNHAPTVSKPIANPAAAVAGGNEVEINLTDVFADSDGDTLKWTAASSNETAAMVRVVGAKLYVEPLAAGVAKITVTADDGRGEKVADEFDFTVNAANQAPVLTGTAIAPASAEAGALAVTVDVSAAFEDEDKASLSYSAQSSNPAAATVSVTGSTLSITPLAAGTTTITVTATDAKGLKKDYAFAYTVVAANQAPVLTGTAIAPASAEAGASAVTADVSAAFDDEDKASLIYSAQSSNLAAATVSVTGSTLSIAPLVAGTTTITVTATDAKGRTVDYTFDYVVTASVLSGTQIVIDPGYSGDPAVTADVSVAFNDELYTSLTYTVKSSDGSVATVSIADKTLTVTPLAEGSTTITITATDDQQKQTDYSFTYSVVKPVLTAERKDDTPFYSNGTGTQVLLNAGQLGFTYGKRNIKDYIKFAYKGKEISGTNIQYDPAEGDFNVMDGSTELGEIKVGSSTDQIQVSSTPSGIQITPNALLPINLDADILFSVETAGNTPQVIEVPVLVDRTAPVAVVESSDDFTTFTFAVNEKLIPQPIVGMQLIPNVIVNDNASQLSVNNGDYLVSYDSTKDTITLTLNPSGLNKIKNGDGFIPNDTKFTFNITMTDLSDNLVAAPVTFTVSRIPD
ncbi:S-layer homology domain-containing protein [Paenibacillus aurantiacus]|uniref:S-layer homology domain-containing protein n=1 Tax=Paenibacillus aurantiacus TaxID=1936118 RepID=A0ABV5KXJ9_9BACL